MSQYDDVIMSELNTYPNPVSSLLFIESINSTHEEVSFGLYNTVGQLVKSGKVRTNKKTEVDLSDLSQGIYYLQCMGMRRKVVKSN